MITPGSILTEDDLRAGTGVGINQISQWLDAGLPYRRAGGKGRTYLADEVIAFLSDESRFPKLTRDTDEDGRVASNRSRKPA